MKTSRIKLFDWNINEYYDNIEIDWPRVHKHVGTDQINWLLEQPKDQCQLVLDKTNNNLALNAEFYDEKTLVSYHLMWAK